MHRQWIFGKAQKHIVKSVGNYAFHHCAIRSFPLRRLTPVRIKFELGKGNKCNEIPGRSPELAQRDERGARSHILDNARGAQHEEDGPAATSATRAVRRVRRVKAGVRPRNIDIPTSAIIRRRFAPEPREMVKEEQKASNSPKSTQIRNLYAQEPRNEREMGRKVLDGESKIMTKPIHRARHHQPSLGATRPKNRER